MVSQSQYIDATIYFQRIIQAYREGKIEKQSNEWGHAISDLNLELLDQDFQDTSVDYLTHPNEYVIRLLKTIYLIAKLFRYPILKLIFF